MSLVFLHLLVPFTGANGNLDVSGITTAAEFVGGGSDLRNLSGTHLVSYASASDISDSALSISGISTYNEVGILTGSRATNAGDNFGYSVATSADGNTIVVGARLDEWDGASYYSGQGTVYVFDRNGNTFNEVGFLTSTNPDVYIDSDYFGHSVATSADGKTIFVGSYEGETGSINPNGQNPDYGIVHVFDREGNNFNEVGILTGTYASGSDDQFGKSVATSSDGKTIIVGAPRDESNNTESSTTGRFGVAYVFNREGNNFNEVGILTAGTNIDDVDNFGHSVATSSDGKTIIVGALYDEIGSTSDTGVVYVFDREGNNFNEVGILTGSYASDTYDQFGYSLATSADGKTIVVGASGPSTGTDWGTGDEVGIGTTNTGVVYVFDREGNNFNEVGILTGSYASDSHDQFGHSVATSADGKTIVVGARNDEINPSGISSTGLVYVFNRQGNNFNEVGILLEAILLMLMLMVIHLDTQ